MGITQKKLFIRYSLFDFEITVALQDFQGWRQLEKKQPLATPCNLTNSAPIELSDTLPQ